MADTDDTDKGPESAPEVAGGSEAAEPTKEPVAAQLSTEATKAADAEPTKEPVAAQQPPPAGQPTAGESTTKTKWTQREMAYVAIVVMVLVVLGAVLLTLPRSEPTPPSPERSDRATGPSAIEASATQTSGSQPAPSEDEVLSVACTELAAATPETVGEKWGAVRRKLSTAFGYGHAAQVESVWSVGIVQHELEGVMRACDMSASYKRHAFLVTLERYTLLPREEREALCGFGYQLAEAKSEAAWTGEQRETWNAACLQLLSGPPPSPVAAREPVPEPASEPAGPRCSTIDTLSDEREAVVKRSLDQSKWIAYGRALAACGPDTEPWKQLKIARAKFVKEYVLPLVNGDPLIGSWFLKGDRAKYDRVIAAWFGGE